MLTRGSRAVNVCRLASRVVGSTRCKNTVQCRGVGIFGALGLGGMDDHHEFCSVPSKAFEQSQSRGRRGSVNVSASASGSGKKSQLRGGRRQVSEGVSEGVSEEGAVIESSYPVFAEAGFGHSVVLTNDGKLFLFGRAFDINSVVRIYGVYKYSSYFARLATNLTIEADRDHKIEVLTSPFFMPGMDRYSFSKVACSGGLTAALTSSGQIFCFGVNKFGQCGTGELAERYWFPAVNVGVPKVLDVDVGLQHAICLCIGGDVYTWGKGKNGQMGNGEEEEANPHSIKVPLPVQAVAVGAGLNHCAAAGEDGNVYVWGRRMSDEIVEGSKATYQDQKVPRCVSLPGNLKAKKIFCSSFTTVVVANDDTLWVIGVDEINQDVSLEFQPVYEAVAFPEETYTEEELDKLPKVIFNSSSCVIKKGYHAVSVISSCQEMVYDVTLQRGTARLFEVILEPKEKGKIKDYSAGFRHCLLLTSDN